MWQILRVMIGCVYASTLITKQKRTQIDSGTLAVYKHKFDTSFFFFFKKNVHRYFIMLG